MNISFILAFIAIFIVSYFVGNYIAIDGDELSKSKKLYYKIISIILYDETSNHLSVVVC